MLGELQFFYIEVVAQSFLWLSLYKADKYGPAKGFGSSQSVYNQKVFANGKTSLKMLPIFP